MKNGADSRPGRGVDCSKISGSSGFQEQLCSESVSYEHTQISRPFILQRLTRNSKSSPQVGRSLTFSLAADSSLEHGK